MARANKAKRSNLKSKAPAKKAKPIKAAVKRKPAPDPLFMLAGGPGQSCRIRSGT